MSGGRKTTRFALAAATAATLLGAAGSRATASPPATWRVAPTGNDATCTAVPTPAPCATIQGAIGKAASGDTIAVAVGTYTGAADPVVDLTKNLTLSGGWDAAFGSQTGLSTIDGQDARRAVIAESGTTSTMTRFHLLRGATSGNGGNALVRGNLTLTDSVVENGHAALGAGIATASGFPATTVHVVRSMIWANFASTGGGGIDVLFGTTVYLVNSTIAGNQGGTRGGGVDATDSPSPQFHAFSSTIVANSASMGGGIYSGAATGDVSILNTLLADNAASIGGPDCSTTGAALFASGYNLIGATSGCQFTNTHNLLDVSADLDDTAKANGGPTNTIALRDTSPALDAADPAGCVDENGAVLTVDQRGFDRPVHGRCDIGAFEAGAPANDDFAHAPTIGPGAGSVAVSNVRASVEPGEPEHAGDEGGASVWYRWTPATAGPVTVRLAGASFDPLLAVYTGSTVSGLTRVASNDDELNGSTSSTLCFTPAPSTTYAIAVDGYNGDEGTGTLSFGAYGGAAPCPTLPPAVTGPASPRVGDSLSSDTGTWVDPAAAARQWFRCQAEDCRPIAGATGSSYALVARDAGTSIRVEVTEVGALSTSDPTRIVAALAPASAPGNGRIFFSSNATPGNFDIYSLVPGQTGPAVRLTTGAESDWWPAVSPDGTRLAFVHGGELETMAPDGSNVVDLGVPGSSPTWSPDGSRLAFVFNSSTPFGIGYDSLGVMDADGSHIETIFEDVAGTFLDVAWSPDATRLAFTYEQPGGRYNVGIVSADGRGGVTHLTHESTIDATRPAWSPDSSRIAYVRGEVSGAITDGDLYVVNADGTNATRVIDGAVPGSLVAGVTWSPDGTMLLADYGFDLWTVKPDGSQLTHLLADPGRNETPSWSRAMTYSVTVTRTGTGSGTVASSSGGISCGAVCTAGFADGASVTLTASPAGGSTFAGWSGACSGTGGCVVSVAGGARAVTATFDAASSGGSGGGGGGGLAPDIEVVLGASSAAAPPVGSALDVYVTVDSRNSGGSSDVLLVVTLPAGYTYQSHYTDRGSCTHSGQKLTCDAAFIGHTTATHVRISGTVTQAGELDVTASAEGSPEPEFDRSNNTATLKLLPPAQEGGGGAQTPLRVVRPPVLSGRPQVGRALHATAPTWSALPARVTFQWQLCRASACRPIPGAHTLTLKLVRSYAGRSVRLVATATSAGGVTRAASKRIAVKR